MSFKTLNTGVFQRLNSDEGNKFLEALPSGTWSGMTGVLCTLLFQSLSLAMKSVLRKVFFRELAQLKDSCFSSANQQK